MDIETIESMVDVIFGNDLISNATELVSPDMGDIWSKISGIYDAVIFPVAIVLLVLFFLIEMTDLVSRDNFTIDHMIKLAIKFVLGLFLMENGLELLQGMFDFGSAITGGITEYLSNNSEGFTADIDGIKASINQGTKMTDGIKRFGQALPLLVPYFGSFIVTILIKVTCWSRVVEIVVRSMMAPIAMADIYSGGTNSNGFRYLRKYLAVCLQGAFIVATLIGSAFVKGTILGGGSVSSLTEFTTTYALSLLVFSFSIAALLTKSQGWANDLCGV